MNSFLQGKKISTAAALTRPAGVALPNGIAGKSPRAPGHAHAAGPTAAHVEVVKEGDKVVRLVVTCTCGERVEIECLYPAGS